MENTYRVPVKYTFTGYYEIKAESKEEAREYAEKHCGLCLGGDIHTTLNDEDVTWEFGVHPHTAIGGAKKI